MFTDNLIALSADVQDLARQKGVMIVTAESCTGGLVAGLIVTMVGRTIFRRQTAGVDEMLGLVGESQTALAPDGKVFIRGEYWSAHADENIEAGEHVEVTGVDGLHLRVRRAKEGR